MENKCYSIPVFVCLDILCYTSVTRLLTYKNLY